ncbi:hypothetical protein F5Y00DRAFT_222875 [Daldinia vernicosa]|uniref:uncharacterized protein n=1 Tax=Daldinia vernicosa TaxID=114800 RepID=UPI0020074CE5|nr:uncharacterized protein F5Y00DRAFT_222875 [Daldinia vernicosa]KAI0854345.1 hypothetical protein F5Y00DRAFT_222875 [Daldinia vernicosa]
MAVDPRVADIIRGKKLHYCLCADTSRWHLFENVALPDATFSYYDMDGSLLGRDGVDWSWPTRDEFVTYYEKTFSKSQTIHSVGASAFEQISPDEVKATFSVICRVALDEEKQGTGGGYYFETWVRKDNDWFMKSLRFERTYWHV